ncbi:Concanavalin A-like lectin/glucanases superfamily [uncultured Caudovirales phage]|uniref:Concanavalin A-like lectin/glucanases superfamily n=1 Tax=uncultured Caudovirales phage TaxID=2100421 RepID=A0A6J5MZN6_9CAUD|nr:Concanavalin A-like lectin/glucanases superfamily [uncultured Caudovirales phage]
MILGLNGIIAGKGTPPSSLLTNLVSVYKAESNANDSFGTNNGTSQGGLTYATGKSGNSFVGNGTNAYISFPDNSWNFTGSMSINIWAYISSSSTNSVLYSNYYYSSGGRDYGFLLEHQSNGNLRFYMQTLSNSPVIVSTSYSGKYNSWKMITITKLQNGALRMYVDGVNISTDNTASNIYYNSLNYSSINAARYLGATYGYLENNGKTDEIGIWNKVLTPTEITELYNSGSGKFYPY